MNQFYQFFAKFIVLHNSRIHFPYEAYFKLVKLILSIRLWHNIHLTSTEKPDR